MADVNPPSPLAAAVQAARALHQRGDAASARALLGQAVGVARRSYPEDDPELLAATHALAGLQRAAGDPTAARRTLEQALAAGRRNLGDTDPLILAIAYDLATLAEELGNRNEAHSNLGHMATAGPAVLGADDQRVRAAGAYLSDEGASAAPGYPEAPRDAGPDATPAGRPATTAFTSVPGPVPRPDGEATTLLPPGPLPKLTGHPASAALRFDQPSPTPLSVPRQRPAAEPVPAAAPPAPPADDAGRDAETAAPTDPPARHRAGKDAAWTATGTGYPQAAAPPYPSAPPAPRPPKPQKARRSGAMIAAVVAAVAAVVAIALAAVLYLRDPAPSPTSTEPTASVPAVVHNAPTDLTLRDSGDRITLTWTDPTAGTVPFVVAFARAGQRPIPVAQVKAGKTTFTQSGLSAKLDYCFTVAAYYAVQEYATSGQVCTTRTRPTRSAS
jgi:hypothetical protein